MYQHIWPSTYKLLKRWQLKHTQTLRTGLIHIFGAYRVLFCWFLLCFYALFYCNFRLLIFFHQNLCFLFNSVFSPNSVNFFLFSVLQKTGDSNLAQLILCFFSFCVHLANASSICSRLPHTHTEPLHLLAPLSPLYLASELSVHTATSGSE